MNICHKNIIPLTNTNITESMHTTTINSDYIYYSALQGWRSNVVARSVCEHWAGGTHQRDDGRRPNMVGVGKGDFREVI